MTKKTGLALTFLAVGIAVVAVAFLRLRQTKSQNEFYVDPITFVYKGGGKPGLAAVINGREVTETELIERSNVIADLTLQEIKMLADAALNSGATKVSTLEIYMHDPGEKFVTAVAKLGMPFKVKFISEDPGMNVARVSGKAKTREDLGLNAVQYSQLKSRQFRERLHVLRDLLVTQILLAEAKAADKNIEEFVQSKILGGEAKVSDQEINDFASQKGVTFGKDAQSMRNRLRLILVEQKRSAAINSYLRDNADGRGEIYFLPPRFSFPFNENKMLSEKNEGTPVMVFSNFTCSTCVQLAKNLVALKAKHKAKIRIGNVQYFSPEDWRARLAAEASICLNEQSYDLYWRFFEAMSNSDKQIDENLINETAKQAGADTKAFKSCLVQQRYKDQIDDQLKYSADYGVVTMPTVIIGTSVLAGPLTLEDLEQALGK